MPFLPNKNRNEMRALLSLSRKLFPFLILDCSYLHINTRAVPPPPLVSCQVLRSFFDFGTAECYLSELRSNDSSSFQSDGLEWEQEEERKEGRMWLVGWIKRWDVTALGKHAKGPMGTDIPMELIREDLLAAPFGIVGLRFAFED